MDIEEIYIFLIEESGVRKSQLSPEVDLRYDLGIEADDFADLIDSFSEKYCVNMEVYLWYFHHGEEGWNLGALFFKPPYEQVITIKVTPQMLLESALLKKWPINYPEHHLTKGRPDITFNQVFLLGIVMAGGLIWLW
ncbi:DUF1493 family protein [Aliamphritea spongicola]|uniref:DUF1493 family protein n=1 Tax=Aliamphritea spongicola TaxID=707589 RepID=UPI00196A2C96|nr:DUF1493 family protein [Aliamphritea spongicola]MBN3562051.1 DUF1493 family protein [Aliamphritea spongicola]